MLTAEEVGLLLAGCSNRAPTGIRNQALIVVLYRGQLRISEALALLPKDLDSQRGTLRVLHGKGDKARTIGLDEMAWAILQRWLDKRRGIGLTNRPPVFCTLQGRPLLPIPSQAAGQERRCSKARTSTWPTAHRIV